MESITNMLNYTTDEKEKRFNDKLDVFIEQVLQYDIRGPFIDTILAIKEKRD